VRERLGHPRADPGFRCPFLPGMPSSRTPGSSTSLSSSAGTSTLAFTKSPTARHSQCSRNPLHAGIKSRSLHGSPICYGLPGCSAPCADLAGCPAIGAFYFQASNGSVALPVAGYDYSIDWSPMLVGLSPTGMAASLAAGAPFNATERKAGRRNGCAARAFLAISQRCSAGCPCAGPALAPHRR